MLTPLLMEGQRGHCSNGDRLQSAGIDEFLAGRRPQVIIQSCSAPGSTRTRWLSMVWLQSPTDGAPGRGRWLIGNTLSLGLALL
jgi:hypothetical protein